MRTIAVTGLLALSAALVVPAAAAAVHARAAAGPAAVPAAASPKHMLFDISCVSAKDCVAVGLDVSTDRPVADRWNGRTWAAADLKLPHGAAIGQLSDAVGLFATCRLRCVILTLWRGQGGAAVVFSLAWPQNRVRGVYAGRAVAGSGSAGRGGDRGEVRPAEAAAGGVDAGPAGRVDDR